MTMIAYTARYRSQVELERAYRALGHTSETPAWSATLLIDYGLTMEWAAPMLLEPSPLDHGRRPVGWHRIAHAGELPYPPLRPEEEMWAGLLEKHPVPEDERSRVHAAAWEQSVEEWHRDQLRSRYNIGEAHIGGSKRNPTDVGFDPIIRDWAVTARALAGFVDAHKPPKLTAEQRVMAQGVKLMRLEEEAEKTRDSLARLMRNAARDAIDPEAGKYPHGFKSRLSRWSGQSRPTVDAWLAAASHCELPVPDNDSDA